MRIQDTSPLFHRPGQFDTVVKLWDAKQQRWYTMYTVAKTTKNRSIKIATEAGFGIAPEVLEGGTHAIMDFSTPYYREYKPRKKGFGFFVSTEATESDHMGIIASRTPKQVASINRTKEIDFANMALNLATSSANVTPDGVSLANAAHLKATGTFTNIVSGNPAAGYQALADAKALMKLMPLHEGEPCNYGMGSLAVLCHVNKEDQWKRIVGADKLPGSNDNDPNIAGQRVKVIACPYFDASETAWALVSLDSMENPLSAWSRRGIDSWETPRTNTDGYGYFMNEIYAGIPMDPRGYVFSAGA